MVATVYCDHNGVLLREFMEQDTTITADAHRESRKKLWKSTKNKRREFLAQGFVLVLPDYYCFTKMKT